MKLKQYWPSWREAQRLKRLPLTQLQSAIETPLPVTVSLTSIPSRLQTLHLTIRSLLAQTCRPHKVLLWLHQDLARDLPLALRELEGDVFEIRFVSLTCSHRKLIHTLEACPNAVVVTCDDDMMYAPTWLAHLYEHHLNNPMAIMANECRQITRGDDGQLLPYQQWPRLKHGQTSDRPLLPIGYAGVLYPPRVLNQRVHDVELFLRLAPKADDLWFRAMAFLNQSVVAHTPTAYPPPRPIIGSQTISLLKTNVNEDGNRQQWSALVDFFGIDL